MKLVPVRPVYCSRGAALGVEPGSTLQQISVYMFISFRRRDLLLWKRTSRKAIQSVTEQSEYLKHCIPRCTELIKSSFGQWTRSQTERLVRTSSSREREEGGLANNDILTGIRIRQETRIMLKVVGLTGC